MYEWDREPDEVVVSAMGLPCMMRRGPLRNWCGYIGVPAQHFLYGKEYDEYIPELKQSMGSFFRVHGGITFSGFIGEERELRWIGFDCAHLGDAIPAYYERVPSDMWGAYKNIEYVKQECLNLATQIYKATEEVEQ